MKNINLILINLLLVMIGLSSCEYDDADKRDIEYTPKLGTANILYTNSMIELLETETTDPTDTLLSTIDIWADETLSFTGAYGSVSAGYLPHDYPQGTIFRAVFEGRFPNYRTQFGNTSTTNILNFDYAADILPSEHNAPLTGQLKDGGNYTVIAAGSFLGTSHFIALEDDLTAPAGGNAKIRFVNAAWELSPGANPALFGADVSEAGLGALVAAADFEFRDVTSFQEVTAGALNFTVDAPFSTSEVDTTLNLEAGKIYTLILEGEVGYFDDVVPGEGTRLRALVHN